MFVMLGLVLLLTPPKAIYSPTPAPSWVSEHEQTHLLLFSDKTLSFFDHPENSSGILTAFLSTEATKLTDACSFGWQLGLVATATMPILLSCAFLRFCVVTQTERHFKASTDATGFACEAIPGIRTVACLTLEEKVISRFTSKLRTSHAHNLLISFSAALTYALSLSLTLFVNALIFWYGATKLIATGKYTVQQFFVCYIAVVFSAQGAGSLFSYAPGISGAQEAAKNLSQMMQRVPMIGHGSDGATDELGEENEGELAEESDVELRAFNFAYQSRPEYEVLKKIDLIAGRGQFIGLVGGKWKRQDNSLEPH
ncbi:hypothetical protein M433DRAFT_152854 [Acidomyces richmondensis BFW]|nr:MAG: hypothetical protein FE78DRAFT_88298 [Acidomyces sp. 'richmondensis']KYG46923.1 hypothetical protein M433DRAFT_152854 [Acidomyces richmondensis BFW]